MFFGLVGMTTGAGLVTAGLALAANGSEPGNLILSPASGATTLTPTWSTTDGCPKGFQGSALVDEFRPDGTLRSRISTVINSGLTAPFGAGSTLDGTVQQLLNITGVTDGGTVEWAVACWSGEGGTGSSEYVQSTMVTLSPDGSSYTTGSSSGSPSPTSTPTSTPTTTPTSTPTTTPTSTPTTTPTSTPTTTPTSTPTSTPTPTPTPTRSRTSTPTSSPGPTSSILPSGAPQTGAGGASGNGNDLLIAVGATLAAGSAAAMGLAVRRKRALPGHDGPDDTKPDGS